MTRDDVIRAFTNLGVKELGDDIRKSLGLSKQELELLLGALNSLPDGDTEIPNLNKLAAKMKIANPVIQTLKKKGYLNNGSSRGKWEVTYSGVERMARAMKLKLTKGHDSVAEIPGDETVPEAKHDIDTMTLGQIAERLVKIDMSVKELVEEKKTIVDQLRRKMAAFK